MKNAIKIRIMKMKCNYKSDEIEKKAYRVVYKIDSTQIKKNKLNMKI